MEKIIAHIDMDCFFCQCEEKKNPRLKGKPVIVGSTGERGVVSAANYEARKYGVYSATPISKARQLCPAGFFLPVNRSLYLEESSKIMTALLSISDDIEQVSVDEAYIDITALCQGNSMEKAASVIQQKVKEASLMSCSVGVSNSRFVSKIASDYKKPGGITVVNNVYSFLYPLEIGKIPGIGKTLRESFYSMGVKTIGDLAKIDKFKLMDKFGLHGIFLQNVAKGVDRTGISKKEKVKSFSREKTLSYDTSCVSKLKETLNELCQNVREDLGNYFFRTISIKIRYSDFETLTRDFSFKTPSNSSKDITKYSIWLFENNYNGNKDIRLVGVKLSNITGGIEKQLTLKKYID